MGSFTGVVQLKLTICDTVAVTGKSASYWGWKMSLDQAEKYCKLSVYSFETAKQSVFSGYASKDALSGNHCLSITGKLQMTARHVCFLFVVLLFKIKCHICFVV